MGWYNKVYEVLWELIGVVGVSLIEMLCYVDCSFCCGVGGVCMWMEEYIGKWINYECVDEVLVIDVIVIVIVCLFCWVMVIDGVNDW